MPHHRATSKRSTNCREISKEILTVKKVPGPTTEFPIWGSYKGLRTPREFYFGGQWEAEPDLPVTSHCPASPEDGPLLGSSSWNTPWFWVPRAGKAAPQAPGANPKPRHSRTIHREHAACWGGKVLGGDTEAERPPEGAASKPGPAGRSLGSRQGRRQGRQPADHTAELPGPDRCRPRREGPLSSALGGGHPPPSPVLCVPEAGFRPLPFGAGGSNSTSSWGI